jgi:hypothetical protein
MKQENKERIIMTKRIGNTIMFSLPRTRLTVVILVKDGVTYRKILPTPKDSLTLNCELLRAGFSNRSIVSVGGLN